MKQLLACDIETQAFTSRSVLPWTLPVIGVGFYGDGISEFLSPSELKARPELLHDYRLVFHNAKFDLTVLEAMGYDVDALEFDDTMVMSWLLNENRKHGLKSLAKEVLGYGTVTKFDDIQPPKDDADFMRWHDQMATYCLDDCRYTYELHQTFVPQLKAENLYDTYVKLEIPFLASLRRCERRGVLVCTQTLKDLQTALTGPLRALQGHAEKQVSGPINLSSPKQLREYFLGKGYVFPAEFRTPKGEPSTNVQALKYFGAHGDAFANTVLEYRELFKIKNTYAESLLSFAAEGAAMGQEEAIHTSFHQTGTVTGRLSSSNPNLQNIPRRNDQYDVRRAFIPRRGMAFVIADYSQVELRLIAHYAQDNVMQQMFIDGKDIHQATADAMGCSRFVAKTINFGLNYGRTAYGMAKGLGISKEEAQAFIDKYFATFPGVLRFKDSAGKILRANGYVTTLAGRRRRFPDYRYALDWEQKNLLSRMERQAGNAIIQGSAADVIKEAMTQLDAVLDKDCHILLQIHDELVVECPEHKSEQTLKLVKEVMENCVKLSVPLTVDAKITNCWTK